MDRRSTPYISVFLLTFIMFSFLFGCSGKDNNISDASASNRESALATLSAQFAQSTSIL